MGSYGKMMPRVLPLLIALLLWGIQSNAAFLLRPSGGTSLSLVSEEEFVGPFPSWACVKSLASGSCGAAAAAYGTAVGDGSTNDTAAIQTALNGLSSSIPVLWFPAGTYKTSDVSTTGTASSGSTALTVASGTGIVNGMEVTGACVPGGDTVVSGGGTTSLTLLTVTSGVCSATALKFNLGITNAGYISVIGHSPADTSITWAGSSGGTMLFLNGVAYSRFDRITWNAANGGSPAGTIIDQAWDGVHGFSDTQNEYADDVFENAGTGFRCGFNQNQCSEVSMLRDQFLNNTIAGISTYNFNALDVYVWYSLFQNNVFGITNKFGAGNFRAYNNVFLADTTADAFYSSTTEFTMRGNYSSGSNYFWAGGGTSTSNVMTIQGNTVLDTAMASTAAWPFANKGTIYEGDAGPLLVVDNVIRSINGAPTPVVNAGGDLFSIGNTFTAGNVGCGASTPSEAYNFGAFTGVHCHGGAAFGDVVVSRSSINPTQPALPPTPPNYNRTIFETSPSGSGTTCSAATPCSVQTAICEAATGSSAFSSGCTGTVVPSKNVVHLLPSTYTVSTAGGGPLLVPANADIQIIGDGAHLSALNWSGTGTGPVLELIGPNKATLRDFVVGGNSNAANGILITNADQAGSRIYGNQLYLFGAPLLVNQLDYTRVEMDNFYPWCAPLGNCSTPTSGTAVSVVGGTSANSGNWLGGTTAVFCSDTNQNYYSYAVSAGGHLDVADVWDSTDLAASVHLTGTGTFTISSSGMLPAGVAATLTGFQGVAAFPGLFLTAGANLNISGNGTGGQVLGLGLAMVGSSSTYFADTTSPADSSLFWNSQNNATGTAAGLSEASIGSPSITTMLNQMRTTAPVQRTPTPVGVTDVGIYRVFVSNALVGIDLEH